MTRMTVEEYRALMNKDSNNKPSKYGNRKVVIDGFRFDSEDEGERYEQLKLLKQSGEIASFNRQPSFLFDSGIRYRPDFIVFANDGRIWVEDVKGYETDSFKIKKKLWDQEYPHFELRIIKMKC